MKIERSKEWWLEMVSREGDSPVEAGTLFHEEADYLRAQLAAAEQRATRAESNAKMMAHAADVEKAEAKTWREKYASLRTAAKAAEAALERILSRPMAMSGDQASRTLDDALEEIRAALTQLRAATAAGGGQ